PLADRAPGLRKLLGPEDDQRDDEDENDLHRSDLGEHRSLLLGRDDHPPDAAGARSGRAMRMGCSPCYCGSAPAARAVRAAGSATRAERLPPDGRVEILDLVDR